MLNGISRSFVEGYLLGLAGLPVKTALGAALPPAADREKSAMFLYNGMGPLPALPEGYDRCPYATVTDMGGGAYRLHLSDVPFFASLNDSGTFSLANYYNDTGILFYMFTHNAAAGSWSVYNPDILGTNRVIAGGREKGWANYDMLTKEGDVYIHKSAPIPVIGGKENPIAPSVFLVGLRFGILSRHGKALPKLPDGVLISSDGYILTDCNGVYLIAAVDAEPDDPDEPAVPEEPGEVATMYLYGTPSESGNIGLRVGDTVTYYDGAVLPALPETDMRYGVIVHCNGLYRLWYSEEEIYARKDGDGKPYYFTSFDTSKNTYSYRSYKCYSDYAEWEKQGESIDGDIQFQLGTEQEYIWTKEDVYYYFDKSVLIYGKSDPIPVSGIVEYINDIPIYE